MFFADYGLVAYDHAGRELWRTPLGPFDNVYGMGASPILAGGLVVLVVRPVAGLVRRRVRRQDRPRALARGAPARALAATRRRSCSSGRGQGSWSCCRAPSGSTRYDLGSGEVVWFADGLPSEMKSGAVLDGGRVFVVGYGSPLNEPGQHLKLPALRRVARGAGCRTRTAASRRRRRDATSREYFDFIDLDKDGVVSRERMADEPGDDGGRERPARLPRRRLGRRHAQRPACGRYRRSVPAAADAARLPRRALHDQRRRHPDDARRPRRGKV